MKRVILSAAALALLAACAARQPASEPTETVESAGEAAAASAAETKIVTETGRWETEGSRDTLVRLKGPVGGWTASRR